MKEKEDIYQAIYDIVKAIPAGRVTSYGAIAAAIGMKSGARLVGHALKTQAGMDQHVPAHRVVNRIGLLSGRHHFSPPEAMQQLLEAEGVVVKDDQVVDFEKLFWDPIKEIAL